LQPLTAAPPTADALRATSCSLVGGCGPDTPLVPEGDLPGLMTAVPAWTLGEGKKSIHRKFTAKNFLAGRAGGT
jgi:hypothetical protein